MQTQPLIVSLMMCVAGAVLGGPSASSLSAQTQPADKAPAAQAPAADAPAFKPEELDQMVAPLALYPDSLLSQILMASTYPLEIVEADRWAKAQKDVKSDAAAKELEAKTWDASVKSLVNFPDVLTMMSEKLDWTQKLGDAFIGQQKDLMDAVQRLRGKAKEAGKLESTEQQKVEVKAEGSTQTIIIESTDPDVIYIPAYDPVVIYGSWPHPGYPPYPYYPPHVHPVATGVIAFGAGVACGLAWGYAWGNCDWGHSDININVNKNINRNTNINRNNYNVKGDKWQHNPAHRGSVPYRNQASAQRFGGKSTGQATRSREEFRGREGAGAGDRPSAGSGKTGGTFEGVNRGGREAAGNGRRGHSSRGGGGGGRGGGGRR